MNQRQYLKKILKDHKDEIDAALINLITLSRETRCLEDHSRNPNIDITFTEESIVSRTLQLVPLSGLERATNCDTCKRTCHYPCTLNTEDLWRCWAMDYHYYEAALNFLSIFSPRPTNCSVCPNKCPATCHSNTSFQYTYVDNTRPLNIKNIRQQHQTDDEELSPTQLNERVLQASSNERARVQKLLREAHSIMLRLDEIALRPQKHEVSVFIQEMIYEEERTGRKGWEQRVEQLQSILKHDKVIEEIKRYSNSLMASQDEDEFDLS